MPAPAAAADRTALVPPRLVEAAVARVVAVVALGWFAVNAAARLVAAPDVLVALVALDHVLNVAFAALARPARAVDRRAGVVAFTALVTTYGALLDLHGGRALVAPAALEPLVGAALLVDIAAKLALGRSFGLVPADRGLVCSGPYRAVRHPMYAAYLVVQAALVAAHASARNVALYALFVALLAARIALEERVLARDPAWRAYAARTRARLVPFVW